MGDIKKNKQKKARDKLPELPSVGNQRKWNIVKVVLRSICLLLSIVDVGELIALDLSQHDLDYWTFVAYPVLGSFLLWDVIEFVVIIVRGSIAKGVHPGAHVGVELILCLGGIFTVAIQAYKANWYQLTSWGLRDTGSTLWAYVALTQFSFLSFLTFLRFILFVRACVEVDRRKRDRRVQQLVFAIQEQGRDPQDVPLAAFTRARELDHVSSSQILKALSPSTMTQPTLLTSHSASSSSTAVASQPPRSPEDRDFAYKYNFPIATVPELLENGIHPEDARNQKVLIGAFPR
ncbi:hypothetical protein F5B22DRAFT_633626 [Xylaria bambusicola]|uniref:uncharacterized protein n=1 Tax=Xylaria bambusicola TaxID=326684 RepID=UPI0020088553|nr:uncharacterized protein F5B22DRAFT_633626 [Xylaria bambusicola]KAI0525534.1 hypothetical protein F5B22DRAFT_633626 [Xylaria bambusicola]